jgi:hypothetical protein
MNIQKMRATAAAKAPVEEWLLMILLKRLKLSIGA